MRIGELAETVGVTTRAVRHYHHLGLLPEPDRLSNGYRDYTLRHAVALARIRRLTELGVGLAEVRDVLADDAGKDLVEVLGELDEDLARQEGAIRERRARLRVLLEAGELSAEGPVSPELAALFARTSAGLADSPMAAKDREVLALIETAAPPEVRERMLAAVGAVTESPETIALANEAYALLDDLVDAEPDDPRVEAAAHRLAACVPPGLLPEERGEPDSTFLRAFCADFPPAQAAAIRRTLELLGVAT
ncbi:MerR family transcriptional regulator [Streptomyces roseirectus]|uniref:MerR family transcriptional regulator n=1 Tax=Streptomyces roseirectus TaxID=2768066 RepID=A0A7H0IJP8_9ACTN|nr:MerR family transcriptional regulator [Streptomyces roseirectus]QNP73014.1 MerR family transcriptional regulator [Streptomyces roseirectus]